MTTYFAFRASPELIQSSHVLMQNFDDGAAAPQSELFVTVSRLFADEVVDVLLLNLVHAADSEHGGVLTGAANLIKGTVNMLIRQVLGHMDNDELRPQADYIRERRMTLPWADGTADCVAFAMPADVHERFRRVLERALQGDKDEPELQACMELFVELACTAFYDEALERLRLGYFGRKTASVGGTVIRKGGRSAIRRLVTHLEGDDLKRCADYLLTLLVTAEAGGESAATSLPQ